MAESGLKPSDVSFIGVGAMIELQCESAPVAAPVPRSRVLCVGRKTVPRLGEHHADAFGDPVNLTAARRGDREENDAEHPVGMCLARTTDAVNALAAAGILRQRNVGRRRYRVFEATDVLDLFTGLERAIAGPTARTAVAGPVRQVPGQPVCRPGRS